MFNFINNLFKSKPVDEDREKNLETLKLVNAELKTTMNEFMGTKDIEKGQELLKKLRSLSRARVILEETLY